MDLRRRQSLRSRQEGAMNFLPRIRAILADERFSANLIAIYVVIIGLVAASLLTRRMLRGSGHRLAGLNRFRWLDAITAAASRHAGRVLFWITLTCVLLTTFGGLGYHALGRDVREDVNSWYQRRTAEELFDVGVGVGSIVGLVLLTWLTLRVVRRLLPRCEAATTRWFGRAATKEALGQFFRLLETYAVAAVRLLGLWAILAQLLGVQEMLSVGLARILAVTTILFGARLATLAFRVAARTTADVGDQYLENGKFRRYWDRIARLVPFAERCFEAAVYIQAAYWCVRLLDFIPVIAGLGPRIVECIGILFVTRVAAELLQVLLNEAFGLCDENRPVDQKSRTLVPLLNSVCQYVLYFGAGIVMLGVLGVNTTPILAGAGILGLAVGLGAQNLVTDVVSGFFILFEGQFLVGDFVQIGDAAGTVEAVGIRLTQIRDGQGRLYIIPNGQIKAVVNYSKSYVNALVDLRFPSGADLEGIFRSMAEAGRRLRQARKEVLADTEIQGLVELGTSEMTIRAVTKVHPGTHVAMQNEYRRLLKQVLDQSPQRAAKAA
jgi:small conductance mechanosensitive channel